MVKESYVTEGIMATNIYRFVNLIKLDIMKKLVLTDTVLHIEIYTEESLTPCLLTQTYPYDVK
jgi:hypothetical protein